MSWDPNPLEQKRLEKLAALQAQGINPYPLRVQKSKATAVAMAEFEAQENETEAPPRHPRRAARRRA